MIEMDAVVDAKGLFDCLVARDLGADPEIPPVAQRCGGEEAAAFYQKLLGDPRLGGGPSGRIRLGQF